MLLRSGAPRLASPGRKCCSRSASRWTLKSSLHRSLTGHQPTRRATNRSGAGSLHAGGRAPRPSPRRPAPVGGRTPAQSTVGQRIVEGPVRERCRDDPRSPRDAEREQTCDQARPGAAHRAQHMAPSRCPRGEPIRKTARMIGEDGRLSGEQHLPSRRSPPPGEGWRGEPDSDVDGPARDSSLVSAGARLPLGLRFEESGGFRTWASAGVCRPRPGWHVGDVDGGGGVGGIDML